MNFGLIVSKQHPPGVSMVDRFREHIDQVRAARDAGFDLIVMGQHFLSTPFQEMQSLPALARLAAEAGTMRVGATVILLPLLNPVDVAEQVATLDVITEGRFIFGVGLGYREEENEAFGIAPKERVGRLVESLEVITRLWSGEEVTHHGRFFHLTRARMMLRPVQRPHPPIWFAASPAPGAASIVSARSSISLWTEVSTRATFRAFSRRTGWSKFRMGRMATNGILPSAEFSYANQRELVITFLPSSSS